MQPIAIYIANNATAYGGAQPLRQAVLLVCIPDRTATYDANGYITSVSYNGKTYSYEYDGVGRLSSETKNGATTNYSYNSANNITQAGNKTFVYDAKNRLVKVGSDTFSYDAMGNPTKYKGNTFTWEQGRKLSSGSMNGKTFTYAYDGSGMRFKKTVNGTTTYYYYDGSQLLMESTNGSRIWYIYGVTGIEGMIVEGGSSQSIVYYFDKNTLGDIVAIRDISGSVVATYSYDAWGSCTVMDGYGYANTSSSFIGNINPFRYRGYYYDVETGFYYLQTRYYDPTICRFINADNYELISQLAGSKELNMYAYCRNNPIMYTDATGEGWILALILIGSAVAGGIWNGIESYKEGNSAGQIVLDVFIGASAGLAVAGGTLMLGGIGTIAVQSISGMIGVSASLAQMTALGTAAFNLGGFIMAALQGIKTPEPVEFPAQPQAPTYYTPITGY